MKQISLREFQLKPTAYLKELPLVLTQYGKPIAKVVNPTESVNTIPVNDKKLLTQLPPSVNTSPTHVVSSPKVLTHPKRTSKKTMGYIPESKNKSIYYE